ncbi:MAG: nucleotidyltransferase family protein [Eubacteriales bacterium]|nr:nucleotidyltransferase family protein [Eubacteriales bacterium]
MEKIVRVMMNLIASEVCGKALDRSQDVLAEDELALLYRLSKAHDLAHIVGDALIKNDLIPEGEIRSKFDKQLMMAVYRYERINYELEQLKTTLNSADIPFIPLKGSVIRRYYPEPWMRTSSDIDLLIKNEQLESAINILTTELSYEQKGEWIDEISLYSPSGVHIELHCTLSAECVIQDKGAILSDIWAYAEPIDGTSTYILTDEAYYYYHVAHMAKHMLHGGCGVRPFVDLWILEHKVEHCNEKRNELLECGGLRRFADVSRALSEVWFGDCALTGITHEFEAYILQGGVYGTTENRVAVQQVKKGGKLRYALSRIWLPYDVLRFQYPSLTGKKALLPLYEVRRWFKLLFRGGVRRSVNELRLNSATTEEEQTKTKALLGELGIDC